MMRKRWTPERDEELGSSVGWDEVEEYMWIEKEVMSLISKFMVKTGKVMDLKEIHRKKTNQTNQYCIHIIILARQHTIPAF